MDPDEFGGVAIEDYDGIDTSSNEDEFGGLPYSEEQPSQKKQQGLMLNGRMVPMPEKALSPYQLADIASMSQGLGKAQTGMESGTEFTAATGGGLPGLVKSGYEAAQSKVIGPLVSQAIRNVPLYQAAKIAKPDLVPNIETGVPLVNLPLAAPEEKGVIPALSRMAQGFTTPENIGLLPFAGLKPVQAAMLLGTGFQIPETIKGFEQAKTLPEYLDVGTTLLGESLMAGGLAHGLAGKLPTKGKSNAPIRERISTEIPLEVPPGRSQAVVEGVPKSRQTAEVLAPQEGQAQAKELVSEQVKAQQQKSPVPEANPADVQRVVDVTEMPEKQAKAAIEGEIQDHPKVRNSENPSREASELVLDEERKYPGEYKGAKEPPVETKTDLGLPPVKKGFVRVFRGRSPEGGTSVTSPEFTADQNYARSFAGKSGVVDYVDIPVAEAQRAFAAKKSTGSGVKSFVLSKEWVNNAKEIPKQPEGKVYDLEAELVSEAPKTEKVELSPSEVDKLSSAEFAATMNAAEGGLTGEAYRVGRSTTTPEALQELASLRDKYTKLGSEALKAGDIESAMSNALRKQYYREAYEAATGTGSAGEFLRKREPGYVPPMEEAVKPSPAPEQSADVATAETAKASKPIVEPKEQPLPQRLNLSDALMQKLAARGIKFSPGITPPGTGLAIQLYGNIVKKMNIARQGLPALFKSRTNRHIMDQTFDAVDNMAAVSGRQMRNRLALERTPEELRAAYAAVEANGDIVKLDEFINKSRGKNEEAMKAAEYAKAKWGDRNFQSLVSLTESILDDQLAQEHAANIMTEAHDAYVPHIYDQDLLMGVGRPVVISGKGGGGASTGFKKGRVFDTIYDAIEAGYNPKSINVADAVEHRIRVGQKLINRKQWAEALKSEIDPSSGLPVVADLIRKSRGPGQPGYEVAPPGYSPREIIPGVRIAINDQYSSLFDALTGSSRISGSVPGQAALKVAGGIKHGLLAFDTFHASRIGQKSLFLRGSSSYRKGMTLLDYSDADLAKAVRTGEITQEMADYATANRPKAQLLLKSGLNVGRIQENLYNDLIREIPGIGTFNKWVFEKLTRGAMMESGLIEFERIKNGNPNLSDRQVALKVARDMNVYFGNLGRQGLFKSKTFQDLSRLVFLAPQWVESMARTELKGLKQLTADPILNKTLTVGSIGKGTATGLLAYFVGTQLLNLATRGNFTWDNPEKEHKLDAYIPDVTGESKGYFLSPFSVVAELTHDMLRFGHTKPDLVAAASNIIQNKTSPFTRAARILYSGEDWDKKRIEGSWNKVKAAAFSLAPTPIPLSPLLSQRTYPGQMQRQLLGSAGIKVEPVKKQKVVKPAGPKRYPRAGQNP